MALSQFLLDYVHELDKDRIDNRAEEQDEGLEGQGTLSAILNSIGIPAAEQDEYLEKFTRHLVQLMVKLREGFIEDKDFHVFDELLGEDREFVESYMDEHYTRQQLRTVPSLVHRTLQFSLLPSSMRIPSEQTRTYLGEATRTYIFGLSLASIALSRAALEQALKDRLERQGKGIHLLLSHLIQEAYDYSYLDGAHRKWADEIAGAGNRVLHEKPATPDEAFDVLTKLRGVLAFVFTATGEVGSG